MKKETSKENKEISKKEQRFFLLKFQFLMRLAKAKIYYKYKQFKEFLIYNKIVFEVFSYIVVGIMGVILSAVAINIAYQQNKLTERSMIPFIEIIKRQEKTEETGIYDNNIIIVSNIGEPLYEFDSKVLSLINICYLRDGEWGEPHKIQKILNGYYFYTISTQASTGVLCEHRGYKNNTNYVNLEKSLREQSFEEYGIEVIFAELEIYMRVEYFDVMEKNHVEYYLMTTNRRKMNKKEGEEVFSRFNNKWEYFTIDTQDWTDILSIVLDDMNE